MWALHSPHLVGQLLPRRPEMWTRLVRKRVNFTKLKNQCSASRVGPNSGSHVTKWTVMVVFCHDCHNCGSFLSFTPPNPTWTSTSTSTWDWEHNSIVVACRLVAYGLIHPINDQITREKGRSAHAGPAPNTMVGTYRSLFLRNIQEKRDAALTRCFSFVSYQYHISMKSIPSKLRITRCFKKFSPCIPHICLDSLVAVSVSQITVNVGS
jgi:hypothetical protein